jgi:hypothetical protein
MDQSCPVVHKSCRPQARLQTAKLFCNNCVRDLVRLFKTEPTETVALCFGHRVFEPIDTVSTD